MEQIALTSEQMKHLTNLGLDTSNASMIWEISSFPETSFLTINRLTKDEQNYFLKSYAYTLQDMLNILNKANLFPKLYIDADCWAIEAGNGKKGNKPTHYIVTDKSALDVTYKMLCWCLEHKYM